MFLKVRSAVGEERWRFSSSASCSRIFSYSSSILFCVLCFAFIKMGNEPLTRKILEEILDVKLS